MREYKIFMIMTFFFFFFTLTFESTEVMLSHSIIVPHGSSYHVYTVAKTLPIFSFDKATFNNASDICFYCVQMAKRDNNRSLL